ncbi:MAG: patatin-like phospholipase family protein [Spirochaetia bacterium]|jgi:NTE family protein|nr:patatin-like phospholipase family protein [Spirochaetia bacterium]
MHQAVALYPKVALVLSGGGAKGIAEIPVIQALEDAGIPIDFVCGTSQGALVAGLYAAGYTPKEMAELFSRDDIVSLLLSSPIRASQSVPYLFRRKNDNLISLGISSRGLGDDPGFIGDQKILNYISSKLVKVEGTKNFSDLPVPFAALATNVSTGEAVKLKNGSLVDALRASMSLPVAFFPFVLKDGTVCMDGGLVDNLPVSLAKEWGADIIIAVDVTSEDLGKPGAYSSLTGVINQTISLATFHGRAESQRAADLLILPDAKKVSTLDYSNPQMILEIGQKAAEARETDILALAAKISQTRALEFRKDTKGPYDKLPVPVVDSLSFRFVAGSRRSYAYETLFTKYIGKELTPSVIDSLKDDLLSFRDLNGFSTVSFEFEPSGKIEDGKSHGTLVCYIRNWDRSTSSVSLGMNGSLGISSDQDNKSWMDSIFSCNLTLESPVRSSMEYIAYLDFGSTIRADLGLTYGLGRYKDTKLSLLGDLIIKAGSLSVATDSRLDSYVPAFGSSFGISTGFDIMPAAHSRFDFVCGYSLALMGSLALPSEIVDLDWQDGAISIPSVNVGYVWNTRVRKLFSDKGQFFRVAGGLSLPNQELGWFYEGQFTVDVPIDNARRLIFDAQFGCKQEHYQLTDSYYDIGGLEGFPGYPQYFFRRGYTMLSAIYEAKLRPDIPLYFLLEAKAGAFDTYDPIDSVGVGSYLMEAPEELTDPFGIWDFGVLAGCGIDTDFGNFVVGLGCSVRGRLCLSLAVL